jgi:hypothetical protein
MPEIFDALVGVYHRVEEDAKGPQHWTFWLNEKDYEALRDERCGVMPQKLWNAQIRLATQKVDIGTVVVENKHPEAKKPDLVGIFKLFPPKEGVRDGDAAIID